jgi:hypothetical protein
MVQEALCRETDRIAYGCARKHDILRTSIATHPYLNEHLVIERRIDPECINIHTGIMPRIQAYELFSIRYFTGSARKTRQAGAFAIYTYAAVVVANHALAFVFVLTRDIGNRAENK